MSFRTVVIRNHCKIEYRLGYLVIRADNEQKIHISEIRTLILETAAISLTGVLIVELIKQNVNIIFCDEKRMPHSYVLPFNANYVASKNIRKQISWEEKRKKELWRLIIKNKIYLQAKNLLFAGKNEECKMLESYESEVLSNDLSNREGHAAKVYFNALFSDSFSRRTENDINKYLNYGYSILLSCVSRAIVEAGYITQIGIWHHSEYNEYNLACDLMEPFRPIIDQYVCELIRSTKFDDGKSLMARISIIKIKIKDADTIFENAIEVFVRDCFKFLNHEKKDLILIDKFVLP